MGTRSAPRAGGRAPTGRAPPRSRRRFLRPRPGGSRRGVSRRRGGRRCRRGTTRSPARTARRVRPLRAAGRRRSTARAGAARPRSRPAAGRATTSTEGPGTIPAALESSCSVRKLSDEGSWKSLSLELRCRAVDAPTNTEITARAAATPRIVRGRREARSASAREHRRQSRQSEVALACAQCTS